MEEITQLFFRLVGNNEVSAQAVGDAVDPTLVIMDGKLVLATNVVQPTLTLMLPQTPAKLGELVVVEAKLNGECPQFVKGAKINWVVSEGGNPKQCWTQGRNVIFGAGVNNTAININAKLTLSYQVDTQVVQKVVSASGVVHVGSGPAPGPNPTPGPNPAGVPGMVAQWATDPAIVPADGHLKTATKALSSNFKALSQKIGQEGLTEIRAVLLQTKSTNNDALMSAGVDPRNWDNWGKKLQDYLFTEYSAKRLSTVAQLKKVWWDISTGLWSVK